jgi:hypothetical protein
VWLGTPDVAVGQFQARLETVIRKPMNTLMASSRLGIRPLSSKPNALSKATQRSMSVMLISPGNLL